MSNIKHRIEVAQAKKSRKTDAEAAAALEEAAALEPTHSGWMFKKGGVRRSWARRWFEVRGDYLFRSETEGGAFAGSVDLRECAGVRASIAPDRKEHELELLSPERTVRLQCGDAEALSAWLLALVSIAGAVPDAPDGQPELGEKAEGLATSPAAAASQGSAQMEVQPAASSSKSKGAVASSSKPKAAAAAVTRDYGAARNQAAGGAKFNWNAGGSLGDMLTKTDPKLEQDALAYVVAMTGALTAEEDEAGAESGKGFFEALKTGKRLCALVNAIRPGIVPKVNKMAVPAMQMENIGMFLTAAETLGMKPNECFRTPDLWDGLNVANTPLQICLCLCRLRDLHPPAR